MALLLLLSKRVVAEAQALEQEVVQADTFVTTQETDKVRLSPH